MNTKKLEVPFSTLKTIYHISDIHIRLIKRHEEYTEVFNTLYKEIQKRGTDNAIIVITGDILHAKCELSPEAIQVATDLLTSLSKLCPTITITGNHDCNLANSSRLDALSPICSSVTSGNLYYLKYSGVYRIADVEIAVMSLLGNKSEWPTAANCDASTAIALYHGGVYGVETDVGYRITNRDITADTFDGFDLVLLGDIHRHQVIQDYEETPRKPLIIMNGSTIQQNHGENPTGHGLTIWNVPERTYEFVELPNDHGYYTLRVENGVVPNYSDMPQNVRLRVFAGNMPAADVKKLVANIRNEHNVVELAVTQYDGVRNGNQLSTTQSIIDIYNVDLQNKLIESFVKRAIPSITHDTLQGVFALNERLNKEIVSDDVSRKTVWQPLWLKFDNLFTFKEGNHIDFTNMKGITGIFAPNASGKTSISEVLSFVLYDQTPRTTKAANIMNFRKNSCYCEFHFKINDTEYVIERTGKRNKKGEVKIDVNFYQINPDSTTTSLNGEERRLTNKEIVKYVGEFDDFILTTLSSSSQTGLFVDKRQSERKDLLSQFIGLNILDKLHTLGNEEHKSIAVEMKRFKQDDFTQELVDVAQKIEEHKDQLATVSTAIEQKRQILDQIATDIQEQYERKVPLKKNYDPEALERSKTSQLQRLNDLKTTQSDIREKMRKLQDQLDRANIKLSTGYKNIEEQYHAFVENQNKLRSLKNVISTNNVALDKEKGHLEYLEKHKFDPNCLYCVSNATSTIESKREAIENIEAIATKVKEYEDAFTTLEKEVSDTEYLVEKYKNYKTGVSWVAGAKSEYINFEVRLAKTQTEQMMIEHQLSTIESELVEYQEMLESIKLNRSIDLAIRNMESNASFHKQELAKENRNYQSVSNSLAVLTQTRKTLVQRIEDAKELEQKHKIYQAYLAAVGRDGLPYTLIADMLPTIESAVNNVLSQMVEFTLSFEMDGKDVNIKLQYDEEQIWPLELASGMEKFVSGLAIRVALMDVSSLPKSTFLIIDEGLGALDQDNLANIFALFDVLKSKFSWIWLISHVGMTRDLSDSVMEITRQNRFSTINYQ